MTKDRRHFAWMLLAVACLASHARAATFTSNTYIGTTDSSFDFQDIEVTNCTLTIDGPHTFQSLHIENGGLVTHSFASNGFVLSPLHISGELQVMSDTNPPTLNQSNVMASTLVLSDTNLLTYYTQTVDYVVAALSSGYSQLQRTTNSSIPDGSTVIAAYDTTDSVSARLSLTISNNVEIEIGGAINLNGIGYGPALGPGSGRSAFTNSPYPFVAGSGGGHGGFGGSSSIAALGGSYYDSIFLSPVGLGSGGGAGGGPGGPGGGTLNLSVGAWLRVDGQISANGFDGTNAHSGGGSGGSLLLSAQAVSGSGSIVAHGGAGEPSDGGGGGGGRISVHSRSNLFAGAISAHGGAGATVGGAGTIYLTNEMPQVSQLLVDNAGLRGTNTPLIDLGGSDLIVTNGATAQVSGSFVIFSLLVASNSFLTHAAGGPSLTLTVLTNATVSLGGAIIADARGYAGGTGPGLGNSISGPFGLTGGGAGYGGYGGGNYTNLGGGIYYGSGNAPVDLGSGGGAGTGSGLSNRGGSGGGSIRLTVNGRLTVDGRISANGATGVAQGSGGGSGGSIFLDLGTLAGVGSISANGGSGEVPLGGGGGGGRVSVRFATNQFTGLLSAYGATGAHAAGAGTVYTITNGTPAGQVVVDNGGLRGTNTPLPFASATVDLTVTGGGSIDLKPIPVATLPSIRNLLVRSNGWMTAGFPANQVISLSASGNATVESGGGLLFDGLGYPGGQGPGGGQSLSSPFLTGGGAGHGGYGGSSAYGAAGGNSYDSPAIATQTGSGGGAGAGSSTNNLGGAGGGALSLSVQGALRLDGILTANGRPGVGQWSGGGSGGGLYINAGTFSGQGMLSANGGAGDAPYGGGGGGGRVFISSSISTFNGTVTARGGSGWTYGGAGTISWNSTRNQSVQIVVDNGGFQGTNTPLSVTGPADLTVSGRAVATAITLQTLGNLLIASNSWLTFTSPYALHVITVTSNATIQAGGGILLDGQGQNQVGFGSAGTGSGGGYGGYGGNSVTNRGGGVAYGSISAPIDVGSVGGTSYNFSGPAANGGGALHLIVLGPLALDGTISANGLTAQVTSAGGGSGGSVWISTSRLSGSGMISADGGSGDLPVGGGGGGGRVALYYATNQFSGVISARGGAGANYGGAGTIYLQASNGVDKPFQYPRVLVDNGGNRGTNTPVSASGNQFDLTVTGGGQGVFGAIPSIGTLLIGPNSSLSYTSPYSPRSLTIASNATIQAGGSFSLDGQGFARGNGTGAGRTVGSAGGGGGYGGYGGTSSSNAAAGGGVYGSIASPIDMGSGGGGTAVDQLPLGGAGGGALHLTVNGTLAVDGALTANGVAGSAQANGGGSGGSLWLTGGKLTGAGTIWANGGSGDLPAGGGGGGGRISISFNTNQFAGAVRARGGAGAAYGGAGTIYITSPKGLPGLASALLLVDNGGQLGTNTPLSFSGLQDFDLTLGSGASALASNQISCRNLLISSNGFLVSPRANIVVSSNATIQAGGGIILDALGFAGGAGSGAGRTISGSSGGGGGYGGYGASSTFAAAGGTSYGSFSNPIDSGSGGGSGNGSSTNTLGGAGGGALQMTVSRTFICDGTLSANGGPGIGQWSGGGSGGSIWVSATTLIGAGLIVANGGAGDLPYGGGGGGGRVAIYFSTNRFAGTTSARGGIGATAGGAGTIYVKTNSAPNIQITIDNGGNSGTNTPITVTGNVDLTVGGGAIAEAGSGTSIRNILIESNSWIAALPFDSVGTWQLTASNNLTIKPTGGISANGRGFSGNSGQGRGGTTNTPADGFTGAGGGYAGFGGQSIDGAPGGNSYGSTVQPFDPGSGGGGLPSFGYGGPGGGVIRLTVSNNLVVDGTISANGLDGFTEGAGGGSGGSVWLTAGTFSGAGLISANGGSGDYFQGGGGGGGRIAVYFGTSSFTGALTAYGGYGASVGGAGTVYGKANAGPIGQLLIDNGGPTGTNTPVAALGISDLSVLGGAMAAPQAPLTLNSLLVDFGGRLTHFPLQSPLDLLVFGNGVIGTNGAIVANGNGYTGSNSGPGAGQMPSGSAGSGGGYGGLGGASASGTRGGTSYGSAQQPTDFGSSGGYDLAGSGYRNLSQGGGAVRLRVAGALTLNGKITANGDDGTYDRSGGGAGGSIWLTARSLDGHGFITANGGSGELFDGGGGSGGRIAIYTRTNTLTGPIVAFGGYGYNFGGSGTVIITNIPAPSVIGQIPSGSVSYTVSNVDITFGPAMNFSTASTSDVIVYTPFGGLPDSSVTVSPLDLNTLRLSFPSQNTVGYYEIDLGPEIQDIYGLPMADTYIGSFVISSPTISGRVLSTNGTPVSFVTLRAGSGLLPAVSDANGQFSLEVPPGWSGTVTPSKGSSIFIPGSRSYVNLSADATNQNFISAPSAALAIQSQKQGNNLNLSWFGINGVSYQTLYSTNLADWLPYGAPLAGTNGTMTLQIPVGNAPAGFFRFSSSY